MDNVVELWRIILSCVRSLYGMDFEKSQISQNISTSEAKCTLFVYSDVQCTVERYLRKGRGNCIKWPRTYLEH